MSTTSDLNSGLPTDADKFTSMDDAAFAREFGLTVEGNGEQEASQTTQQEEPAAEAQAEGGDKLRDDKGRFVKQEQPEEEKAAEADEAAKEEAADKGDEKTEKQLVTQFKVYDAEGELEVPELELEFTANGKTRKLSLDRVVRLAQSGYYNEQLVQETDQLRAEVPQLRDEAESLRLALEDQKALTMRLLQDDDYLLQTRESLQRHLSPEGRAERAEQELRQLRERESLTKLQAEAQQFTLQTIQPKLESLQKQYPSITDEELYGRFVMVTAPLTKSGQIPKGNWSKTVDAIDRDIGPWMAQLHEARQTQTKESASKVTRAQEEATKAKRTLARALKPATASSSAPASPKPRAAPSSVDEAANQIIDDIVSQMKG